MHDLVSAALADGRLDLTAAREAAKGVADAMSGVVPADKSNVLRQVFDGMTEAVSGAADAAKRSLNHAAASGKRLSTKEVARLKETLQSLEHEFLTSVRGASEHMSSSAGAEWKSMVDSAKKAGTTIRPAAKEALSAAADHTPTLAVETVKAGARAARALTGELAMGLSGVFSGVGAALRGRGSKKASKKAAKKATKKKLTRAKTSKAPRRSAKKKTRR